MAGMKPITETASFATTILLARLLSPAETGPAAAALIVLAVADIMLYQGFGTTLIRRREATYRDARTVLSMTLLTSVGGCVILLVVFGLPATRDLFGDAEAEILQLASLGLLLTAPNVAPQAVLVRQLAFKTIEIRAAVALIVGSATSVGLAAAGLGGEAIVLGLLTQRFLNSLLTQILVPGIKPGWDRTAAHEVVSFGGLAALAGVFHQMRRNVDYLILGALLSPAAVGLYYRAYLLGADYQQRINVIVTRLALPVFSQATDLDEMWRMRRRLMRVQMSLIIPFLGWFVAIASLLVPTMYGDRWSDAVVPAQLLTIVAAAGLVWNGTGPLLTAAGRPGVLATSNGILLVTYCVTVGFAADLGLVALCCIIGAFNVVMTLATSYWMLNRVLGLSIAPVLRELAGPLVCVAPTVALAFAIPRLSEPGLAATALWAAISGAWLAVTYTLLMRVVSPASFAELSTAWRQFLRPLLRLRRPRR